MNEPPKGFGLRGFALVPICCLGLPLLLAAGLSVTALALLGGLAAVVIVAATATGLLLVRSGGGEDGATSTISERARRS